MLLTITTSLQGLSPTARTSLTSRKQPIPSDYDSLSPLGQAHIFQAIKINNSQGMALIQYNETKTGQETYQTNERLERAFKT